MRVGRGDGSTDDADVCGLRTARHTRPEVESRFMYTWVWLLERHVYTHACSRENPKTTYTRSIQYTGCLIKGLSHTCGRSCLLVRYHGPSRMQVTIGALMRRFSLIRSRVYILFGGLVRRIDMYVSAGL
jgi:hypothetical protein